MTLDLAALQRDVFLLTALALVVLERFRLLRRSAVPLARRWTSNLGLLVIGAIVGAVVLPAGTYAFAAQQPPGILARMGMPFAAQLFATFLLLDFCKYWEHRLFHAVPMLWRLHLVHHSDTALDVTTTERHHPVEVALGIASATALVWMLGLPASGLALYVLAATVVSLYSHANLRVPSAIDRHVSRVLVTPPVHAVHHSDLRVETDSNFGTVLTVWDRLFGTFVEPAQARIPHVGLAYFHRPPDTGLWGVLLQPLRFRRELDYPARTDEAVEVPARSGAAAPAWNVTREGRWTLGAGALGLALVLAALWPTVVEMTHVWRSESYQYAWLVVPMLIYFVGWHDGALRGTLALRPGLAGVGLAVAAGLLWSVGELATLDVARQLALVLALHGVALATLGWPSYRRMFPALALLFFMVPTGDVLLPALRLLTLKSLDLVATLAQLPHGVDGFAITVGPRRYIVIDECAGLSYVTLAAFLGYCFGLLLYGTFRRSAGLALAGAAIGIASNVLRVNAIMLVDWMRDSALDLTAHATLQWVMLIAALGGLLYLLGRAQPTLPAVRTGAARAGASRVRRYAPLAAGACAAVIAFATLTLGASGALVLPDTIALPARLAGLDLAESPRAWTVDSAGRTRSLRARYMQGERTVEVVLVQTRHPTAKLAESVLAPDDGGVWREKAVGHERGCRAEACTALTHVTWKKERDEALVHAYFAYAVGTHLTDSRLHARALHGVQRLTGGREPAALVAIVCACALDPDDAATALHQLHTALRDADTLAVARASAE